MKSIRRLFVEKKPGFNVEAEAIKKSIVENLNLTKITQVRLLNRYDMSRLSDETYKKARYTVFSEPTVDFLFEEAILFSEGYSFFAFEYLPGQYDQRSDSAIQCIKMINPEENPVVKHAKVIGIDGYLTKDEVNQIKKLLINPVDSWETSLDKPNVLEEDFPEPEEIEKIKDFTKMEEPELERLRGEMGLAMTLEDLKFVQNQFNQIESRNPTETEIRILDTYWSDHCRHTTFLTEITEIKFGEGPFKNLLKDTYNGYLAMREEIPGQADKPITLMDMAVIMMKYFRQNKQLEDLDVSEEINACSIKIKVDNQGKEEEWLLMFKNETHNHPTEIEPFGGAATCLGGAIRDPLSGRAFVYQAMRVTGSGDPRASIQETLPGKLPQRVITKEAARGYSSYGNQIGLATGQVTEIYHDGYRAKRMEVGAVLGAAPIENVIRETPEKGDHVILLGGKTGRDGCGGATGSSKAHTETSIHLCGAEVQKGNPPVERNIQRLFRRSEVARLIKRSNDFGAGGISVAVGEIAESVDVNLDVVPKKYMGLNGTEISISESQERMAVVVEAADVENFIGMAAEENIEATSVGVVTDTGRFRVFWKKNCIVDLRRSFLDSNGVRQKTAVEIESPLGTYDSFLKEVNQKTYDLNKSSQKTLIETFDSTIGAGTVLMPLGGKYQLSKPDSMVCKIPVVEGETETVSIMSHGFDPYLSQWSPYHGAYYAVVEAVAKIVAVGGTYDTIRLSFQEYFERLEKDPKKWGKPMASLLGAIQAQKDLGIPAIGGKDSMSGSFMDLHVPPSLIAFGVTTGKASHIISPEFKQVGHKIIHIKLQRDAQDLINMEGYKRVLTYVHESIKKGHIVAAKALGLGGLKESITEMAMGNKIGCEVGFVEEKEGPMTYGELVLEVTSDFSLEMDMPGVAMVVLGKTVEGEGIRRYESTTAIDKIITSKSKDLHLVFQNPVKPVAGVTAVAFKKVNRKKPVQSYTKPRIFIPVFPGTNCEYDSKKAFEKAGGLVNLQIIKNRTEADLKESIEEVVEHMKQAQILMIPGGFSGGDEPDGSAKFINAMFRNPYIKESIHELLNQRDGLILGICNGFQGLIKLGLVPYGHIKKMDEEDATLTFNTVGKHMSTFVQTKVVSAKSPWFSKVQLGDIHTLPISHGEGRFYASETMLDQLIKNGQIATQYVDKEGNPTGNFPENPNGSLMAVEAITSPDGRILGKMAHSERIGAHLYKNIPGEKDQQLFEAGVEYFR